MATFNKKLNPRAFIAMFEGRKKIEIRANSNNSNDQNSINNMRIGDLILFKNTETKEQLNCKIRRIQLYKTVRGLLETEGTEFTLSSTNDLEEGIKSIESISNYKELIEKNGVFAIEIEPISLK